MAEFRRSDRTGTLDQALRLGRLELRLRWRQPGLPLTALLLVVLTAAYLPPPGASYQTLTIGGHRGSYTSDWVGLVIAVLGALAFALPAFLMVRGRVGQDVQAGVWPLLETSPLSLPTLLLSRWVSQTIYLWSLWGLVVLTSLPLLLVRGESSSIDLAALLLPAAVITAPALALVSAAAILFDSVPRLSGLLGSLVYLLLWSGAVMLAIAGTAAQPDPLGVREPLLQLAQALGPGGPVTSLASVDLNIGITAGTAGRAPLSWSGLVWTPGWVTGRLVWFPVATLLVLIGAGLFRVPRPTPLRSAAPRRPAWWARNASGGLVRAGLIEWTLAWREVPRWLPWLGGALWAAAWFTPMLGPLLLIVTVPVASQLVTLPRRYHLSALLGSVGRCETLRPARLVVTAVLLILPLSSAVLRALLGGQGAVAAGLLAGAVVTLGLVALLGRLRLQAVNIDVALLLLWYIGPFNGLAAVNYASADHWLANLTVGLLLIGAALVGRWPLLRPLSRSPREVHP